MTFLLTQQRWLGFLTGVATGGALYISTKRLLWRTAAQAADALPGAPPPPQPRQDPEQLFGPGARAYMVRKWNLGVDAAFHPVIKALADRNL